jgi:hypothetical protein
MRRMQTPVRPAANSMAIIFGARSPTTTPIHSAIVFEARLQHDNPGSFGDLLWVAGFQRRDDPGLPGNCLFFTFLFLLG